MHFTNIISPMLYYSSPQPRPSDLCSNLPPLHSSVAAPSTDPTQLLAGPPSGPLWVLCMVPSTQNVPASCPTRELALPWKPKHSWGFPAGRLLSDCEEFLQGPAWSHSLYQGLAGIERPCESESRSVMSNSLRPHGLYSPWNSLGQNTRVGSLFLGNAKREMKT